MLNQICRGGVDQWSFAFRVSPDAPNSRRIEARPSSLGLSVNASTSAGSTRSNEWIGGFELATMTQAESARPVTITTADSKQRISVNGVPTSLDEFRGTPYVQVDLRVSRPFYFHERWSVIPFVEFFNLFNRNNPGANYVANVSDLPVPLADQLSGNVTAICTNPACTATVPVTSLKQLEIPAGALGDFFGPGTTVGIPFAAQIGARVTF